MASFVEAGVKVLGSEVTYNRWRNDSWNTYGS